MEKKGDFRAVCDAGMNVQGARGLPQMLCPAGGQGAWKARSRSEVTCRHQMSVLCATSGFRLDPKEYLGDHSDIVTF